MKCLWRLQYLGSRQKAEDDICIGPMGNGFFPSCPKYSLFQGCRQSPKCLPRLFVESRDDGTESATDLHCRRRVPTKQGAAVALQPRIGNLQRCIRL